MGIETVLAVVGGIGGAISVVITSLRKRQDVSISEMERRIKSLEERVQHLETENQDLRTSAIDDVRTIFRLRATLAANGIDDPTTAAESAS